MPARSNAFVVAAPDAVLSKMHQSRPVSLRAAIRCSDNAL